MGHYHNGGRRSQAREESYGVAYRYLRKHAKWLRYASYRRQGLPMGRGAISLFQRFLGENGLFSLPTCANCLENLPFFS
jgi:hypothetical protein